MTRNATKKRMNRSHWAALGLALLLLFSAAFLFLGRRDSSQADASFVAGVRFCGEYRVGDGDFSPVVEGEHIPATRGDVTLRGYFLVTDPFEGEPLGPVEAGTTLSMYLRHLSATLYLPSGEVIFLDTENPHLGEDACAIAWESFTVPEGGAGNETDPVTIVLHNPHAFGNRTAVDEFLSHLSLAPGILLEKAMLEEGNTERRVGVVIIIAAIIMLGIAVFSTFIHIRYSAELWLMGFMSFFAGGYFLFDAFAVCLWNDDRLINTRAPGLCIMLYMLFSSILIAGLLRGRLRAVATGATLLSGAAIPAAMVAAMAFGIRFYDAFLLWVAVETAVVPVLSVCLLLSLRGSSTVHKLLSAAGLAVLTAFLVDEVAIALGLWAGGVVSKGVFLAVLLMALVIVLRIIPSHVNAASRARRLEAEQQAMQLELQESRIAIMRSQMQPHFIFNTLNTIYHLCDIDTDLARSTISSFSEYLRNNIDTLGQSGLIPFEKEFSFIKTYLDIEKVRFDDELEITYDVGVTDFSLPVLTVQPLVENAVKHGTSKREGVAQLRMTTRDTGDAYEIVIEDTGVGFDVSAVPSADDGHRHVGLHSVRQRLESMCGGTLTLESQVGVGTVATVRIPKKEVDTK